MKILHVIPAVAARYGGPSVAVFEMCRALQARGVATTVATTDADGAGRRLAVDTDRVCLYGGVPTIFFPRQASEGYKYSRPLQRWLDAHVRDFELVHIHAVFSHSSVAAARSCVRARVPYIVRPLGTLDPWSLGRKRCRKRAFMRLFGDRMLRRAAAIHYTTDAEKRLADAVPGPTPPGVVVPLGLADEAFEPPAPDRSAAVGPYVLALCRLDRKKNLELLIRAFQALPRRAPSPDWSLVIAGSGDAGYEAELKQLADNCGLGSRVSFPGWVTGLSKRLLLAGASIFASPSHQENFGISVAEAMASGVPVLVTPGVNLAADISEAGGGWVVEGGIGPIRDTLRSALADPADRARRGAAARALAERFRWSVVVDQLIGLYQDVLRTSEAPMTPILAERRAEARLSEST